MRSCVTISLVPEARGGPFVFWDDLPTSCRAAAEAGFDAVEIFAPSADALDVSKLGRLLRETGLQLAALGTGAGWLKQGLTLTHIDGARREIAIHFIEEILDCAAEFGAAVIIGSMQGRWDATVPRDQARSYLVDGLARLGQRAVQRGARVLYEPLNRYETNLCNQLSDAMQLLSNLPEQQVQILADLFHLNIEEFDIPLALRQSATRLGHIHFVDSNRRAAGFGHLSIGAIVRTLHDVGYRGYLSAEAIPWPDSRVAAAQTMAAFRASVTHWP